MKKTILITSLMALMCGAVFAQQTGAQAAENEGSSAVVSGGLSFLVEIDELAETSNDVANSIRKYMQKEGIDLGFNDDGFFFATGSSKLKKKPTDKDYETARNLAYLDALAQAKASIALFYGQELENMLVSIYTEPASADLILDGAEGSAVDPEVLKAYKPMIDNEIKKRGANPNSPQSEEFIKSILATDEVESSIGRTSTQSVGGLVVDKIFEKDGEIGLVAFYSPVSLALVDALNGGTVKLAKKEKRQGATVKQWISALKISTLYLSQGIQLTTDKDGNMVIISYGISTALSKDLKKGAYKKANLEANANIRRFAGEVAVIDESKNDAMKSITTSTETIANIESSLSSKIKLKSDKLNIPGIQEVRQWEFTDPRSDTIVCGSVCIWTVKTAQIALSERKKVKWATENRGGFQDMTPAVSNPERKVPTDTGFGAGESAKRPRF